MSMSPGIAWKYTAMKARLGPFDAFLVFPPLLLFMMKIAWWTFMIMVVVIVSMWLVEIFLSMPMIVALKSFRSVLAGNKRAAVPWWKKVHL